MSIASELTNLEGNIEDSYDAVNDMGGIIPAQRNMDNLDQAIRTIPQNTGTTYTAGTGIDITSDVISVDNTTVPFFTDLATVATTGDYGDLLNTPTIPAAQVNSDWNANSGVAQILNKPSLATVATSGSYNDLSNKPTIPESMTVYVDESFASPSSITSVFSDSALTTPADPDAMASVISAGGTVGVVYDGGQAQEYIELSSVNSNSRIPEVGKTFTSTISTSVVFSAPTVVTLVYNGVSGYWSVETTAVSAVNDATLTIQHNGTNVQTFTANQSTNATANIETIYADTITPTTAVATIGTTQIADHAVTPAKLSDTGWVQVDSCVNTTYFAIRSSGDYDGHIYYRVLGGVVYWRGAIYCHTSPNAVQVEIMSNIPAEAMPASEHIVYGSLHYVNNSDYSLWLETLNNVGHAMVHQIDQNVPAVSQDWQGYCLSQINYISKDY